MTTELVDCKNKNCDRLVSEGIAGGTCCVPCANNMQRGTKHPHAWICTENQEREDA